MISVVIRAYNEEKYLPSVLSKLKTQDLDDDRLEIILVDSGSTDKTVEIAKDFNCEIVSIKKEEFSFGRSLNIGCEKARGDYLVLLSAHCIPYDENWLTQLLEPLKSSKVALTYSRQVGGDVTKFSEDQVFKKYYPSEAAIKEPPFFCNNASSAIKKSLWQEKRFDEDLTGLEDLEWAKYYYQKRYSIVYCAKSVVYHLHEENWKRIQIRFEREAYALREILPEIHFNIMDFFRAIFRGIVLDFKASLVTGAFFKHFLGIILFRFHQFYGVYKGNHVHRKISGSKKEKYFYP